jgi:ketosteroid isomerase-like protein
MVMSQLVRAVIGGLLLASAISAFAAESGASVVDAAWVKAMKAGNVSAVVDCYASDAVFWTNGAPLAEGTNEIRASYEGYFAAYTVKDALLIEMGNETVGEKSVSWGRFVITAAPKTGGTPVTTSGRYTVIAKRTGGKWVYTLDHASNDPTPVTAK